MTDKELWEKAQKKAQKEYDGDWEGADKYEREDLVFSAYMELKSKQSK